MANNIGCRKSQNKTRLVDPNDFDGQDSISNVSVPLEDLTILVELNTVKKARTLLTTNKTGVGTAQSTDQVTVRFLEGTNINGKKVLTTKFTDLTTTFDDYNDGENLGITGIDIDFNSQFAPMITIHFVDVRGSAIFQNEDRVANNVNKYSVFFQLPYPLYELTIKGYYGQPVKYCLHMTKFTSRFNSQTGNFEITASFIGYTYAILSDMLLGYLKTIEYTSLGGDYYKELKKISPKIITLDDFRARISNINASTKKLLANDKNYALLKQLDVKKEELTKIGGLLETLGQAIDFKTELTTYPFIISDQNKAANTTKQIEGYNTNIKNYIDNTYNTNNNIRLNSSDFIVSKLVAGGADLNNLSKKTLAGIDSNAQDTLYNYITNIGYVFGPYYIFDVYDLRNKYTKINETIKAIDTYQQQLRMALATSLQLNVKEGLGFDPTVRNIVNIFTTAVEVFLHVLYTVSQKAADPANTSRISELKNVFKTVDNSDITPKSTSTTVTKLTPKYYAWPSYRKEDQQLGYQDEYLGNAAGIKTPTAITELNFIDDLLDAFIKQAARSDNLDALIVNATKNWFPINPLDTRIFTPTFPYKRITGVDKDEIVLLTLLRAITFLGYTNDSVTPDEIKAMATAEANEIINDIDSKLVLQAITQYTIDKYLSATGKVNGVIASVLSDYDTDNYFYDYIFDTSVSNDLKVLPINNSFNSLKGTWNTDLTKLVAQRDTNAQIFLTNYNTTEYLDSNSQPILKPDDGGQYIKIITPDVYNTSISSLVNTDTPVITSMTFKLSDLKAPVEDFKNNTTVFNAMAGSYGIQDYKTIDFGDGTPSPYRFIFYDNGNSGNLTFNKSNGLGLKRGTRLDGTTFSATTPFDFPSAANPNVTTFRALPVIGDYLNTVDGVAQGAPSNMHRLFGNNLMLAGKVTNADNKVTYPYVNFSIFYPVLGGSDGGTINQQNTNLNGTAQISLFGSRLYYEQTNDKAKALLFLHTFPWKGLTESDTSLDTMKRTIFSVNEIMNTFARRGGFISTPKIWAAFIGGMLWRYGSTADPILYYAGNSTNTGESFIPYYANNADITTYPTKGQYIKRKDVDGQISAPMSFESNPQDLFPPLYLDLDPILIALPDQAKNEFINIFNDFVTNEWFALKQQLEIFSGSSATWKANYNTVMSNIALDTYGNKVLLGSTVSNIYTNTNSYAIFSPITEDSNFKFNYFLEIKDGSDAANKLIDLFTKNEVIIANSTYKIWKRNNSLLNNQSDARDRILVKKSDLKIYLDTIYNKLSGSKLSTSTQAQKKSDEQKIFGTTDEKTIKFMLYKTCKSIYDKWIGGTDSSDDIIFRCGRGRSDVDMALGVARGFSSPKLIDSFRFVTRSFRDIGDELAINPTPIAEILVNNPNTSFYDIVTSLLSANHFNFTPLPSFINYKDPKLLESMFAPVPNAEMETITNDKMSKNTCGPSFVCVYVGETSKHLDFNDSQYTNDGFDARCNGGTIDGLPKDFSMTLANSEDAVTFFNVRYGQQNQNIFKDIILDQSEFGETAESLKIIDDISKKGMETNRTLAGQNIYNVYSVRSYKVEVEMMGNAMIQPMMYFQLDNIPMFHGAYMITRVRHSIKPNYMSTHFTGVRIRKPETKIIDVGDLYMSILDTIDSVNITNTVIPPFGSVVLSEPPIIATIIENGGVNGNIVIGNIKTKALQIPTGIIKQLSSNDTDALLNEASDALNVMLTDWVSWMKANGFQGNNGYYAGIIGAFRTYQQQQALKASPSGLYASDAGESTHGWGIAVDFQFYRKNGIAIDTYDLTTGNPNIAEGYDYTINESLAWLVDNSYVYGWIIPIEYRGQTSVQEFWHFEYHGKSAACLLTKQPIIKDRTIDTTKTYNAIVKNPFDTTNKEAIYNTCDYKLAKIGYDGTTVGSLPPNKNINIVPPSASDDDIYKAILLGIGAPTSDENLKFFYAWRQAEGGNAAFNPFNTTLVVGNVTNNNCFTSNGRIFHVKNYENVNDGITATVRTLRNRYFPNLLNGLINNIGANALSNLSDLGKWCGGCKGYVNSVLAGGKLKPPAISRSTVTIGKDTC